MKVPYSWLKAYLPELPPVEETAELLTRGGLEVEEIRSWEAEDGSGQDEVLITSVTANRGDLLSLVGVARHAAALLGQSHEPPGPSLEQWGETVQGEQEASAGPVGVAIEDPLGCPRYSCLLLEEVEVGPSPEWMVERLEAAGLRSINNVVDVTNYICWELGQPMHAFDFRLLQDGQIIVRRARAGEEVMLIDETVPPLTEQDVVIADAYGAVALAGIMGGYDSQMRESTNRVLLEAAHFDPTSIRKTALRLGVSTESSYRFERFVDPNLTLVALARAAELLGELGGAKIAGPAVDVHALDLNPREVSLRPERCNALLGLELEPGKMAEYLERIGCGVEEGDELSVTVPTFRPDVEREVDLIEEVAIVHGYNNIPMTLPGKLHQAGALTREQRIERRARAILRQCGLNETLSYSMMCERDLSSLACSAESGAHECLPIRNPMIAEHSAMRTTMLPALLVACATNQRQRVADISLYEINRVFFPQGAEQLPREESRVAAVIAGSAYTSDWNRPEEAVAVDFYWMKGVVEQLLEELAIEDAEFVAAENPTFAPGACAEVKVAGRSLGYCGQVAEGVLESFEVVGPVFAMELDFGLLLEQANLLKQYRPLPRFPEALRDVAVVVPDTTEFRAAALREEIRAAAGPFVQKVEPFDLYEDAEKLGAGNKSLAFELRFRAVDRTLTEEELDTAMEQVHERLTQLGGQVRAS